MGLELVTSRDVFVPTSRGGSPRSKGTASPTARLERTSNTTSPRMTKTRAYQYDLLMVVEIKNDFTMVSTVHAKDRGIVGIITATVTH